jgi:hypothetical protein
MRILYIILAGMKQNKFRICYLTHETIAETWNLLLSGHWFQVEWHLTVWPVKSDTWEIAGGLRWKCASKPWVSSLPNVFTDGKSKRKTCTELRFYEGKKTWLMVHCFMRHGHVLSFYSTHGILQLPTPTHEMHSIYIHWTNEWRSEW